MADPFENGSWSFGEEKPQLPDAQHAQPWFADPAAWEQYQNEVLYRVEKDFRAWMGEMIEGYLENRSTLRKVVQLVDIRHKPSAQDVQMYDYLRYYGLSGIVVATKSDKLSRSELSRNLSLIKKTLRLGEDDILIPVSALKRTGTEELLNCLEGLLKR